MPLRSRLDTLRDLLVVGLPLVLLWLGLLAGDDLLFGILAVTAVLVLSRHLAPLHCCCFTPGGALRFAVYFLHRSLAGGLDVARRALHPALPLDVHVVEHDSSLPAGQPRTTFLAVISLLPGTLACDLIGDTIRVHSIAGDPRAELRELERRVAALYRTPPADGALA